MPGLAGFCCCIALVMTGCTGNYVNGWDRAFDFKCPSGEILSFISSVHSNYFKDRRWKFLCRRVPGTSLCTDSGYVNEFDKPINFNCPGDKVMTGIRSYHSNKYEDRRFSFQCCEVQGRRPRDCYRTGNVHVWHGELTLDVPEGRAIQGAFSFHRNDYEDRLWHFQICNI